MEKAYIILAHRNASQVYRLIKALQDYRSDIFLHVDKKTSASEFEHLFEMDRVYSVERVITDWAGFGLVQATLNSLRKIQAMTAQYDRVILLSGQDYPIKSNEFIDKFLKSSLHKVFLEYFPLPNYTKWKESGGIYRVSKYFFGLKTHHVFMRKTLNLLSTYFPVLQRKLSKPLKPFAGSQWWIMDMNAVNYLLNYIDQNPQYVRFHKYTFAPDEVFFQTLLLNAPPDIVDSIFCGDVRCMNWQQLDSPHPDVLLKKDFNMLIASSALFARKFDDTIDKDVLDNIDEYLLTNAEAPVEITTKHLA